MGEENGNAIGNANGMFVISRGAIAAAAAAAAAASVAERRTDERCAGRTWWQLSTKMHAAAEACGSGDCRVIRCREAHSSCCVVTRAHGDYRI